MAVHPVIRHLLSGRWTEPVSVAPLVTFRLLFGLLMAYGAIRFMLSGWVEKLYVEPQFFFKFAGFEWIQPLGAIGMYIVCSLIALSALGMALGAFYRVSAVVFFLLFTYTELVDATNYLNHYYLVILLGFWMIWLPAGRAFSLDNKWAGREGIGRVPAWMIGILILQLCMTYFFAGVAKLNYDWLVRAMPLAVWLPEHGDLPLLGSLLSASWAPWIFSWGGAIYDLTIWAWLLYRPTRPWAYGAVLGFHLITWLLFNIGLFPLIMMSATLIFFSADWHRKWLSRIGYRRGEEVYRTRPAFQPLWRWSLGIYLAVQLLLPLRHWLYPGNVLWTEEGYRFSWRVMLVEKVGHATFTVHDGQSDRRSEIQNGHYLTDFQEKQMSIQPDFMVQYARFLAERFERVHGFREPRVTVASFVALNGRSSQRLIDPDFDLIRAEPGLAARPWILPAERQPGAPGQRTSKR